MNAFTAAHQAAADKLADLKLQLKNAHDRYEMQQTGEDYNLIIKLNPLVKRAQTEVNKYR